MQKNTLNAKEDVLQYAKAGSFVIYGTGQFGITLLRFIVANGLIDNVQCFAVNELNKSEEDIMGIPVFGVEELQTNSRVLIAVHPSSHDEIVNTLVGHNISNFSRFDRDCYLQMRRTIHDFYTEQFLEHKRYGAERIVRYLEEIMYLPEIIETNTAAFGEYKNAFMGKDVVLLGNGPSLNKYKPIEGAIHIGVNRACSFTKAKLDYLFAIDFGYDSPLCQGGRGPEVFIEDLKKLDCKKFIGQRLPKTANEFYEDLSYFWDLPEKYYIKANFIKFCYSNKESLIMHKDITRHSMLDLGSVIFNAFEFALFAHPKKIYIVGCDGYKNNKDNYFIEDKNVFNDLKDKVYDNTNDWLKRSWKRIKKFAGKHYPDVEIISVNPIMLKGLFKDIEM